MFFTQDDYKKIQQWLTKNSVKDTEFNEANIPFNGNEIVSIVQGNQNKRVFLRDLVSQIFNLGVSDFVNITDKYNAPNISLEEAIRLIPSRARKEGQVITFLDMEDHWHIYQFKGVLNQWNVLDTWEDLFDCENIINSILPDEEDLTKSEPDANGNSYLSLKDREYNPEDFSGLGRIILRKNIVEIEDPIYGKVKKNILYQNMINKENTIYEIRYDFDLNGEEIIIPEGCVLNFEGGSLNNGNIVFSHTYVVSKTNKPVFDCHTEGSIGNEVICADWFAIRENSEDIREVFNVIKDGTKVVFNPHKEIRIKLEDANGIVINKNDITIEGLNAVLDNTLPLFVVGSYNNSNPTENINIVNCSFKSNDVKSLIVIYLNAVKDVNILNNRFVHVGYCVLQQKDYSSNNVTIDGNYAENLTKDFIEANCTLTAPSNNWIITNNIYKGSYKYPNWEDVEQRFIGITAVNNVVISNNIAEKSSADSMIHLEDLGNNIVISNNVLKNAVGHFIWILSNNYDSVIINDNIFRIDDKDCCGKGSYGSPNDAPYFIAFFSQEVSTISPMIQNNIFVGLTDENNYYGAVSLKGAVIKNNTFNKISGLKEVGGCIIENNKFSDCKGCVSATNNQSNLIYRNNTEENIKGKSIELRTTAGSGNYLNNIVISNNQLDGDIIIDDPKDLVFRNNICNKDASIRIVNIVNKINANCIDSSGNIYGDKSISLVLAKNGSNRVDETEFGIFEDKLYFKNSSKFIDTTKVYVGNTPSLYAIKGSLWFDESTEKLKLCRQEGNRDTYNLTLGGLATKSGSFVLSFNENEITINVKEGHSYKDIAKNICNRLPSDWTYIVNSASNSITIVLIRARTSYINEPININKENLAEGVSAELTYIKTGTDSTWEAIGAIVE